MVLALSAATKEYGRGGRGNVLLPSCGRSGDKKGDARPWTGDTGGVVMRDEASRSQRPKSEEDTGKKIQG